MSIKLNYLNKTSNKLSSNLVLFCDEKYSVNGLKKYLSNDEFSYISDLLKTIDLKKNLCVFDVNSKKKIILISIKKNNKISDVENLGAEFYKKINYGRNSEYYIISDSAKMRINNDTFKVALDTNYIAKTYTTICVFVYPAHFLILLYHANHPRLKL